MIPAGYLLKRVAPPPGWLEAPSVDQVCSVAQCVNDNVVDVQKAWRHNDLGLANGPEVLLELAEDEGVDTADALLFYYEAYEREMASDGWTFDAAAWKPLDSAPTGNPRAVTPPPSARLLGYDVVVFDELLEHSPLSCNGIAQELPVNRYCLLSSLEEAIAAIEGGAFGGGCEDGVYTIFAVHLVTAEDDPYRPTIANPAGA